jgi:2-methylcitrate dehydratase PrpD
VLEAMIMAHEIQGVMAWKIPSTVSASTMCCW